MSDQPVAETSASQHTTLSTDIQDPVGIRTRNLSRRVAVDLRLKPRGYWDRLVLFIIANCVLYSRILPRTDHASRHGE